MLNKPLKIMFVDWYRSFDLSQVEREFEWKILSKHWTLELSDTPDILFYSNYGDKHMQYSCLRIFVSMENARPDFNECDYSFSFDYLHNERNYRFPLYRRCGEYKDLLLKRNVEEIISQRRKFCSFMVSNHRAKERIEFYNRLSAYKPVDSGGRYLNNIGGPIDVGRQNKEAWLRNYKFNITFENTSYPGYTTEKMLEAFVSGTIPIYWGNPLIGLDFNPKAFINCNDFKSFDDVIEHVKEVDQNEALYRDYLSQPILTGGVETDFCREENILARYDEIVKTKKTFISPSRKKIQSITYPARKSIKKISKEKFSLIGKYVKAAKRRLYKMIRE